MEMIRNRSGGTGGRVLARRGRLSGEREWGGAEMLRASKGRRAMVASERPDNQGHGLAGWNFRHGDGIYKQYAPKVVAG